MLWLAGWWDLRRVEGPLGSAGLTRQGGPRRVEPPRGAIYRGGRGSPAPGTAFAARGAGGSNQPEPAARAEQRRFVRGASRNPAGVVPTRPAREQPARDPALSARQAETTREEGSPPARPAPRTPGLLLPSAHRADPHLGGDPSGPRRTITGGADGGARPRNPFAEETAEGRSTTETGARGPRGGFRLGRPDRAWVCSARPPGPSLAIIALVTRTLNSGRSPGARKSETPARVLEPRLRAQALEPRRRARPCPFPLPPPAPGPGPALLPLPLPRSRPGSRIQAPAFPPPRSGPRPRLFPLLPPPGPGPALPPAPPSSPGRVSEPSLASPVCPLQPPLLPCPSPALSRPWPLLRAQPGPARPVLSSPRGGGGSAGRSPRCCVRGSLRPGLQGLRSQRNTDPSGAPLAAVAPLDPAPGFPAPGRSSRLQGAVKGRAGGACWAAFSGAERARKVRGAALRSQPEWVCSVAPGAGWDGRVLVLFRRPRPTTPDSALAGHSDGDQSSAGTLGGPRARLVPLTRWRGPRVQLLFSSSSVPCLLTPRILSLSTA
ncbi:uncharacterized protein LOC144582806 [Callithrix jacchus]